MSATGSPPTRGDVLSFVRITVAEDAEAFAVGYDQADTIKVLMRYLSSLYGRDMAHFKGVASKLLREVLVDKNQPSSSSSPATAVSTTIVASGPQVNAHALRGRKEILCLHLKKPEGCRNGADCQFAHSKEEAEHHRQLNHKPVVVPPKPTSQFIKKPPQAAGADAPRIRKSILCTHLKKPEGCRNGDQCEYAHTEAEANRYKKSLYVNPPTRPAVPVTTTTSTATAPQQPAHHTPTSYGGGGGGRDNTCHRYNTPGGCPFGDSCRFEHPDGLGGKSSQLCKWVNTSSGCNLGDQCRFYHPPTSAAASAHQTQHREMLTQMCPQGIDCPQYDPQTDTVDGCWYAHSEDELRCYEFAMTGQCSDEDCQLKHTRLGMEDRIANPDEMRVDFKGLRPGERPGDQYQDPAQKQASKSLDIVRRFPFFDVPTPLLSEMAQNRQEAIKKTPFIGVSYLSKMYTHNPSSAGKKAIHEAVATKESLIELYTHLLHVEVCQSRSDVRRYDMKNASVNATAFVYCGMPLFRIKCPGLVEKRPSVIRGDAVIARDNTTGVWHRGFVHDVKMDEVHVSFHLEFNRSSNATHWIIFSAPMATYRRQFYAMKNAAITLTPDVINSRAISAYSSTYAIDPSLEGRLNEEQKLAVRRLAGSTEGGEGTFRLFILHGPPGTGKTTTVVAGIASILIDARRLKSGERRKRILVCTPTNHAANLIVEKLVTTYPWINNGHLLRLVAQGVTSGDVSREIRDAFFVAPQETSMKDLCEVDVVVTTIVSSGMLYQCGVPTDHFDHIIIDEAGQATEPELSVPMLLAGGACPAITLVGDHLQLGPVLRSLAATSFGLADSTMERLMRVTANREKFSVKLLMSFRSHPSILRLYNELTYKGELIPAASQAKTHRLIGSTVFPNAREPIGFLHVEGRETRELDSPSWMNMEEIVCVMWLIKQFLDHKSVDASEIVVLSPYLKQCKKIRGTILKKFGPEISSKLTVCSVESYQGREAAVVIMSCVRSISLDERERDMVQSIGFLRQPKRLNVAISRAVAGLYIVGNVGMLQTDSGWSNLIAKILEARAIRTLDSFMSVEEVKAIGKKYNDQLSGKGIGLNGVSAKTMIPDPVHAAKVLAEGDNNPIDHAWRREM